MMTVVKLQPPAIADSRHERIVRALERHATKKLGWAQRGESKLSDSTYEGLAAAVLVEMDAIDAEMKR